MTLWRRFAEIADQFPHRLAVVEESASLNYRELASAATGVSASIEARAGDEKGPVGILLGAGAHAFAAILGTLKLGRPYLPMDPGYPVARLSYMLEECGAAVLITSRRHRERVQELGVDEDRTRYVEDIEQGTETHGENAIDPGGDALVLYTSGPAKRSPSGATSWTGTHA